MPNESHEQVEMPRPTAWPLVLSVGVTLLAAGVITHWALLLVGAVLLLLGLKGWVGQLLPGVGHAHEPLAPPEERARPIEPAPGTVEQLRPNMPGYRFRLPEKVHPISSGVKGGIVGGLVMPIPAVAYGLLSAGSIWLPINLLGGMVLPSVETMDPDSLREFHPLLFLVALFIHAIMSTGIGAMYGVVLPTLPQFRGSQLFFGGVVMPLLWSGICYGLIGTINPVMERYVDWRFFLASQIVYGVAASIVVEASEKVHIPPAGGGA
jgi:hypothetical protein